MQASQDLLSSSF